MINFDSYITACFMIYLYLPNVSLGLSYYRRRARVWMSQQSSITNEPASASDKELCVGSVTSCSLGLLPGIKHGIIHLRILTNVYFQGKL